MQENESTEINNMCDENNVFDLKKYLLSNFFDTKYKKRCLMEIYVLDRKYFDELNRKNSLGVRQSNSLKGRRLQSEMLKQFQLMHLENCNTKK